MTTAWIFDLDDTLFDEIDFLHSSYHVIANELATLYPDLILSGDALSVMLTARGNAFDALRNWLPDAVAEDQLWMRDIYRTHRPAISLRPGASRLLRSLSHRHAPLGIITDGRLNTQTNKIKALGLDHIIPSSRIIISEDIGYDKLSQIPFAEMERRIPEADRYIYFGDNPAKDILSARSLGWTTVQVVDRGRNIHPQLTEPRPDWRLVL